MENVDLLIAQTASYTQEDPDLYMEDFEDFLLIKSTIQDGKFIAAIRYIDNMDTLPREQILSALEKDGYV
ncbi:MAG: hypothetical protein N0C84_00655 [Candidatus Thiodiazotropha taylori]|uniref:Uncharacterized protein n=1 Tax=Candidatus Thiodiazotropha taylori TaxID=2792791 RepID=A0A9E4KA65_9GAMM|nr:hypothetical protein [Candidatus Thiodiazotropha taylori]MCW4254955.1 hypothetical protein [Candidatus Thiodiazotropha taylori]